MKFEKGLPEYIQAIQNDPQNSASLSRSWRSQLLAECDWTQTADSPLSDEDKAAWATYRQELRDLPSAEGFPNVAFPTPPSSGE